MKEERCIKMIKKDLKSIIFRNYEMNVCKCKKYFEMSEDEKDDDR